MGAALPLLFSELIPGFESASHVAKTSFLMYSWSNSNFLGWSGFWYCGFQLLDTYSPLFYILGAVLGWPWSSAIDGVKLLIAVSFFIAGASMFMLARSFSVSRKWSLASGLFYVYSPSYLLFLYDYGSLTYSLGFAVTPIVILALRHMMNRWNYQSSLILGISLALLVLSNVASLSVMIYPMLAYLAISTPKSKMRNLIKLGFLSIAVSFILSAFWLLPYLQYGQSLLTKLFWTPPTGSYPQEELISVASLFTPNYAKITSGYLGLTLIPALVSGLLLKKRQEIGMYAAALVAIFLTVGASITPLFYKIPLVLTLQFPRRFLVADILFLSLLAAIFFDRLFTWTMGSRDGFHLRLKGGVGTIAILTIFLVVITPFVVVPICEMRSKVAPSSISSEERDAYIFLSGQQGYFRVMPSDRYHEWFPQYTLKGSEDGWYDQATSTVYRNFTFDMYYAGPTDVNRTLNGLRILGVRYVMVYFADGGDADRSLKAYMSSTMAPPVFMNDRIAIFEVPDAKLVYAAGSALILNQSYQHIASALGGIVKNPGYDPDGVVVLDGIPDDGYPNVSYYDPDGSIPSNPISYNVSNLSWSETLISFDLNISQGGFVMISSAYFPGWIAEVDGKETKILQAVPNFPTILVRDPGSHTVTLRYEWTTMKAGATALSGIGLFSLLALGMTRIVNRRKRALSA